MGLALEKQVCSRESAQRLKELGVKQETYFYWATCDNKNYFVYRKETYPINAHYPEPILICSAFTVAELGEMLPNIILGCHFTTFQCSRNGWWIEYDDGKGNKLPFSFWDKIEADCRAKMLIYILENKLISAEDINNRLTE